MSKFWHVFGHVLLIGLGIAAQTMIPGLNPDLALAIQGVAQATLGVVNHRNGAAGNVQGTSNPAQH